MAKKSKKKTKTIATRGFGAKNLNVELRRVEAYAVKEDWLAASQVLNVLVEQYPQERKVWEYLAEVSFELGRMQLYQKSCQRLWEMHPTADTAYALAGTYLGNKHPMLALQTFRQALELDPEHEYATHAKETIEQLEPLMESVLVEMELTGADGAEIAALHELGQAYLEQGDYEQARAAENQVLERRPDFVSAKNNLSLISWTEGNIEDAIASAQTVLEQEPANIHALSNLIHFWVVSGNAEAAKPYAEQLKASQASAWDGWTKKAEGLSYLADDEGVVEVLKQAQAEKVEESAASALFYHLAAVALARTGNRKRAINQWKQALKLDPGFQLAQENLDDIRYPTSQQHGAWPFSWEQWLLPTFSRELNQIIAAHQPAGQLDKLTDELADLLNRYPNLPALCATVAERGGPMGQDFMLHMAERLEMPELLQMAKDFALSQNGTDEMRYRAAILAAKANLIPKMGVTLWMGGEWRELMLLAYEFHTEPTANHSKAVNKLLSQILPLLRQQTKAKAIEAEALLNKALKLEPDAPDLLNNLAMAWQLQDRLDEARELLHQIIEQHPDYVFAAASLAKFYLEEGDVDAADAVLKPILARDRFHRLEFSAFSDSYMQLLLAKKQEEGARTWLNMWEQVVDEMGGSDPRLDYWLMNFI